MNRREFVASVGIGAAARINRHGRSLWNVDRAPDYTVDIAPMTLELAPGKSVRTIAYGGSVPGPLLRLREGVPVTIDVANNTDTPEFVHWHGLEVPSDVDGALEEGTPVVPPHGTRRYTFTPRPAGSRWYHSHIMAGTDLHKAAYSGQFGFLYIDPASDPGRRDREIFLALHDWGPYLVNSDDGYPSVSYRYASINGRLLGHDEPIRVRQGERVLVHLLNASADVEHWITLPGHRLTVVALDGNPVPMPRAVDQVRIAPAERVDLTIEMNNPGVWILGELHDAVRRAGLGVVVEYANQSGAPQWHAPAVRHWDYLDFAAVRPAISGGLPPHDVAEPINLVFTSKFRGHGALEGWRINGRSAPDMEHVMLTTGQRYRLQLDNQSTEDHPVHLHRHTFELVHDDALTGIRKDVLLVNAGTRVAVEFTANNPGPTLLHCHLQDHMDAGFMMMFDYRA